ncbi:hypothetical protein QFZ68_002622 [Streptomyces sp. V1I6]|nr:hypothetical protein [Streptomyces sp. V1I6]
MELCPGIIFPAPYPKGTATLLSCPGPAAPMRDVPGSMPERAQDRNAAWPLQPSARHRVTGDHGPRWPVGHPAAPRSLCASTTARPPPLPRHPVPPPPRRPCVRTGPQHPARPLPTKRPGEFHEPRRRRRPLGCVQLPARPRRARHLRHLRRRRGRRGARARGGDGGVPGAAAPLGTDGRTGSRRRGRAAGRRPALRYRPWGAARRAARVEGRTGRLTVLHARTRMFSANFTTQADPCRNGLPTPLSPGKKGLKAPPAPYGDGPCLRCALPCGPPEWNAS